MDVDAVRGIYDEDYARAYDERFLVGPWAGHYADFEVELLGQLLDRNVAPGPAPRWLDVACGTGWYLKKFRGVERAGLDISPAMLEVARRNNDDSVELREGSYLDDHHDWDGRWDVVSCMWFAYCYAGSLAGVEQLMDNLIRWTAVHGAVLVPLCDLEVTSGREPIPYETSGILGGPVRITSFTWDWYDMVGQKVHPHLVAPQTQHLVRHFSPHFDEVSVVTYAPLEGDPGRRRALLAKRKRAQPETVANEAPPAPPVTRARAARHRGRYWLRRVRRRLRR